MIWHNARHCWSDDTLRTHQLSSPAQGNAPWGEASGWRFAVAAWRCCR